MSVRHRRRWILVAAGAFALGPVLGWGLYASITWLRFGHPRSDVGNDVGNDVDADPLMQRYMPRYDIAEVHTTRVAAPASIAFDAASRMDLQQSSVIHAIFRGRELLLGASPPPRPADVPLLAELRSLGWGVLEEVPGRQVVLGAVTQPWQADVVFRAVPPGAFAAFDCAGYVKIVVTIAADSLGSNRSMLRTETRALATDAASRARFRRYWSVFSPGILLIRTQALALARGEAELRWRGR